MFQKLASLLLIGVALVLAPGCNSGYEDSETAAPEVAAKTAADRVHVSADSDQKAIEIAQSVMEQMGGWDAWDRTRFVSWKFFGRRTHYVDRQSGDLRIEAPSDDGESLILMNINRRDGRVWKNGVELHGDELAETLQQGHEMWINDSYWMFMPYKLLDAGVTLKYLGPGKLEDGREGEQLELTFADGAGYTPKNRYIVTVANDSGLVEEWTFYSDAADAEPCFSMPWSGWQPFGEIKLATDHGNDRDWQIAVHDQLPAGVFSDPQPVAL